MHRIYRRLVSGFGLALMLIGAACWAPSVSVCVILCTTAVIALLEFYNLLDAMRIPSFKIMGGALSITLIAGVWLSFMLDVATLAGEYELMIIFAALIAILIRQFPQKNNAQPLATMACTLFGILYVPFLFNYFTKLAFSWDVPAWSAPIGTTGRLLLFYLVAVVKCTDIGAFFIGSRFGRHKLIPRISPNKTWEGFIGGILTGTLASLVFYFGTAGRFGAITMQFHDALILGILLTLLGTVGDLTESMLKRSAGCKDTSNIIPGMGGILDVLDSLLFGAPALFIYIKSFLIIS